MDNDKYSFKASDVESIYNKRAKYYEITHHIFTLWQDTIWRQEVAWFSNLRDGERVLDLCCGVGLSPIEYVKIWEYQGVKDYHITALDYNEKMLAVAKKNISARKLNDKIDIVRGDATNLKRGGLEPGFADFGDASFDKVLCIFGMGGTENSMKAYQEILRVLKVGGTFVLIDGTDPIEYRSRKITRKKTWLIEKLARYARVFWGWNETKNILEDIKTAEYTDEQSKKWGFETIITAIRPKKFLGMFYFLTSAVYVGKKILIDK